MGGVDEPLHSLISGPEAALRTDTGDRSQQHDENVRRKYRQHPRPRKAKRGVSESQHDPQAKRYLDESSNVQRLPTMKGKTYSVAGAPSR